MQDRCGAWTCVVLSLLWPRDGHNFSLYGIFVLPAFQGHTKGPLFLLPGRPLSSFCTRTRFTLVHRRCSVINVDVVGPFPDLSALLLGSSSTWLSLPKRGISCTDIVTILPRGSQPEESGEARKKEATLLWLFPLRSPQHCLLVWFIHTSSVHGFFPFLILF